MVKTLEKEDMKLDMKSEMMSDILDEVGESMDNEEEQDELYNQVLAEAGVTVEGDIGELAKIHYVSIKLVLRKNLQE